MTKERTSEMLYEHLEKMGVDIVELRKEEPTLAMPEDRYHDELGKKLLEIMRKTFREKKL